MGKSTPFAAQYEGAGRSTQPGKSKAQLDRFKKAARELGCDDDPKAFEKRVAEITKPKAAATDKNEK